jgi:transcriptional regulator with XRE-family HTH domain
MMENVDTILRRIQQVRKRRQRNIHECAAFLNLSKEAYLEFEQGSEMLTLPEVELLAHFFGVSPVSFFNSNHSEIQLLAILDDQVQPQYIQIRHKMIRARITSEMQKRSISLNLLQELTGIPQIELDGYLKGEKSIPLDHLIEINRALELPAGALVDVDWSDNISDKPPALENHWDHEFFPSGDHSAVQENSAYLQLLSALRALPKKDQAEVAKVLLEKLKSILNG